MISDALISNTMLFCSSPLGTNFEQMPRLKARINREIISAEMTDFKISSPSIVMRIADRKYYVWLVKPANSLATSIRIKIGGQVYALADTG